jgi:hypothetical protein
MPGLPFTEGHAAVADRPAGRLRDVDLRLPGIGVFCFRPQRRQHGNYVLLLRHLSDGLALSKLDTPDLRGQHLPGFKMPKPYREPREHVTADGLNCWCQPMRDEQEPRVIVHRAIQ